MSAHLLFNSQETSSLVENFQSQNYHQYSCTIIRKVLETKSYHEHESLVVNGLMEVMSNVLDKFKHVEADEDGILQLSDGLYNLLLRVECVEAD
ncbi:hypothetical protein [Hymenobacter volaticus]|uniref:Uncharacterized protein n=1 Tax=Hymenobacter volaticus TaxID=2932254 RepID=A0ABY4G5W6_9BACT|nr:hypothetical protein [Hymenobacter volaticus]UOQ66136.1 hypothetical protein MUN86_22005 [Hymenobacter volaticus]